MGCGEREGKGKELRQGSCIDSENELGGGGWGQTPNVHPLPKGLDAADEVLQSWGRENNVSRHPFFFFF